MREHAPRGRTDRARSGRAGLLGQSLIRAATIALVGGAIETAKAILRASEIDVDGVEYLETPEGRRVFYDVTANSSLRPSVAAHFGIEPFERVVDLLVWRIERRRAAR